MKGVNFVLNDKNEKIAVQIDLKILERRGKDVTDFLDGIIASKRENEAKTPLANVIKGLKRTGKLSTKQN